MILDGMMKRGITVLVTTYLQSRSAGAKHPAALQAVLLSYGALSRQKKENVWHRLQRERDPSVNAFADLYSPPSNDADLAALIFAMMWEAKGPFDNNVSSWVTDLISEVMFDLQKRYNVRWD